MNLTSLCTAIRSQLYFSQITAWSDLIRKNDSDELRNTGRFKYANTATSNNWMKKPRLDIFYRIKPHDHSSTSYFKSQPVVHNFPHVIINDNYGLSVSLRSLPRIQNIPMANINEPWLRRNRRKTFVCEKLQEDLTFENSRQDLEEIGKQNCISSDEENEDLCFNKSKINSNVLTHREKQVLKYKRLIKKRDNGKRKSDVTYNSEKKYFHNLPEFGSINSNRPPLYRDQVVSNIVPASVQTRNVEMISIGTQTISSNIIPCSTCGNVMSIVCLTCHSANNQEPIRKVDKAKLLLNAIQRTSKNKKSSKESKQMRSSPSSKTIQLLNDDCVVCKKQKTQHTYQHDFESNNNSITDVNSYILNNFNCDCNDTLMIDYKTQIFDKKFHPSPKTQFKTPKNKTIPSIISTNFTKIAVNGKSSTMDISNTYIANSSMLTNKLIPKVNLTNLFCNPSVDLTSFNASTLPRAISKTNIDNNFNISMHKSNSAPSLPSSSSSCLSPRFIKQSAAYNFSRTRHSSERSDRSSIGSDEQLSDDDLDLLGFVIYNTSANSQNFKNRSFMKSSNPLIGNLEESLMQKRIVPKNYINGFKILLGASGGFCPSQVTIPAASYFYELKGQTLCTPYMVRMF